MVLINVEMVGCGMSKRRLKEGFVFLCLNYWENIKETFNLMTYAYKVVAADNEDLQKEAFKIRHKVYCSELKYEESRDTGLEEDEFDSYSTHMVIYSRSHKSYVGCARLVHGRHNGVMRSMPFEHHCGDQIDHKILNSIKNSGHEYAEVSRLAIEKNFRASKASKDKNARLARKKSNNAFALLSLYLGIQAAAKQQGIRYLFAIVEPRLLNHLHNHNVPAIQIGKGVDHRGLRVPIMIDVEDIERIIPSALKPMYNAIRRDIKSLKPVSVTPEENVMEIPAFTSDQEQTLMVKEMAQ